MHEIMSELIRILKPLEVIRWLRRSLAFWRKIISVVFVTLLSHNVWKRIFWHVRQMKTQIRLRIRAVWWESYLSEPLALLQVSLCRGLSSVVRPL